MRSSFDSRNPSHCPLLKRIRYICSLEHGIHLLGLVLFLAIVVGPLFALIYETIRYALTGSADILALMIPNGRGLDLLVHSLCLAAAVSVCGMGLGVLAASVLWSFHTGTLSYLRWFFVVLMPIPPYMHALAWSSVLSENYAKSSSMAYLHLPFEGWVASWWVELMAILPIAVGLAILGLKSADTSTIEAGRVFRPDISVFANIVLPLARPAIMAGGGIIFLLTLIDYSVPSLFSVNVYPLEVFSEFSASGEPARALLLAVPFLIPSILVAVFSQAWLRSTVQISNDSSGAKIAFIFPGWFVLLQRLSLSVLLLQAGVLLGSLLAEIGSLEQFGMSIFSAREELWSTSIIAVSSALLCLPPALAVAGELSTSSKRGQIWWLLVTTSMAIPGPLVGIGLISIWNRPIFLNFYGTGFMPILAMLSRFAPLAALVLFAFLRHIDPLLMDAAKIFQADLWQTLFKIRIPMLAPGLFAAASVVFALSAGELGATLIVIPPGSSTLTLRIYNYLHYGASASVAGLCILMVLITAVVGTVAIKVFASWSNTFFDSHRSTDDLEKIK